MTWHHTLVQVLMCSTAPEMQNKIGHGSAASVNFGCAICAEILHYFTMTQNYSSNSEPIGEYSGVKEEELLTLAYYSWNCCHFESSTSSAMQSPFLPLSFTTKHLPTKQL